MDPGSKFLKALFDFPEVTGAKPVMASEVFHHIETTGRPVTERPRRLDPEKYEAAKKEFESLVSQDVCRFSKSSWASPIHMVKKKDGSWRICGDYRRLNAQTVPDMFPIPYLLYYSMHLSGKKFFS